MQKPRLIVISFRLPYRFSVHKNKLKLKPSPGGLATSLKSYLEVEENTNEYASFHWFGLSDCDKETFDKITDSSLQCSNVCLHPISVDEQLLNPFYNGFCNSVLWPLFLYFPSFVVYKDEYYDAYRKVNERICNEVVKFYRPGDVIWVHDYQLMLLPEMLRGHLPFTRIGFFLHIPFPTYELYRMLPKQWRNQLIRGLLGANLIGFQTQEYKSYFLEACSKCGIESSLADEIDLDGRSVRIIEAPISIDFDQFNSASLDPEVINRIEEIRKLFISQKLMLSVDRLDYTKAIIGRLESFELFLQQNPDQHNKVSYILILVPSRDGVSKFRRNRKMVEELISRINGQYGNLSWTPIIYQYKSLKFENLLALYAVADIALVVPVRDGMNLVAKEFVASKNPPSGVLILSETAGSSTDLPDAILVNPNDRQEIADSIRVALFQSPQEQEQRIGKMQRTIKKNNVTFWANSFLSELSIAYEDVTS